MIKKYSSLLRVFSISVLDQSDFNKSLITMVNKALFLTVAVLAATAFVYADAIIQKAQGRSWREMTAAVEFYKQEISELMEDLRELPPSSQKSRKCIWKICSKPLKKSKPTEVTVQGELISRPFKYYGVG